MSSNAEENKTASSTTTGAVSATAGALASGTTPGASPGPAGQGKPLTLTELLKPYVSLIATIIGFTVAANALNLLVPKIIARAIDTFAASQLVVGTLVVEFLVVAVGIFVFSYLQNVAQVCASERVARDLRTKIVAKLATQDLAYINRVGSAVLLTNLTSDVDAVKMFVAQAVGAIVSSVFVIFGTSILLLTIDWKLGLAVLVVLPIIGVAFKIVLGRVRSLFTKAQQAVDRLNKIINESILGSALIRLLNSQHYEYEKFLVAATDARDIGLSILRLFASLIPIIVFSSNMATLMILTLGGRFVINGDMTLGDFTAFNSYLAIVIFPVIVIGFMSTVMAQAGASYARITSVLGAPSPEESGTIEADLKGDIDLKNISVKFGEGRAQRRLDLIKAGSKTAVIGPTAAGRLSYSISSRDCSSRPPAPSSSTAEHRRAEKQACTSRWVRVPGRDHVQPHAEENIGFNKTVTDDDLAKASRQQS
jgi:ATP-binding cassette subfamily B protein